ncbi:MAG: RIP metalloprotease RseP, partial [Nitrospirales bacterium]
TELYDLIAKSEGRTLTIDVRREGQVKSFVVTPEAVPLAGEPGEVRYRIGVEEAAPLVTNVMENSPAQAGGLQAGDRVVRINGQPIYTWMEMVLIVRDHPKTPLHIQVRRGEALVDLTVTPKGESATVDGKKVEIGKVGIAGPGRSMIRLSTPLLSPLHGLLATLSWTELTVVGLYKMIAGEISTKNIGGPITIASISGEAGEQGPSSVIFLIAILSINLGVLNLLPIPILDGGHLLFFTIEAILRRPLGDRQRAIAQQVGLLLLVGIMLFAFWNDIQRLIAG